MSSIDLSECHEEVVRKGIAQPCDRTAVALARDPMTGDTYPVCAFHTRGDIVPLTELLETAQAEALDDRPQVQVVPLDAYRPNAATTPRCPECRSGKCHNCTGWALTGDLMVDCGCNHAA